MSITTWTSITDLLSFALITPQVLSKETVDRWGAAIDRRVGHIIKTAHGQSPPKGQLVLATVIMLPVMTYVALAVPYSYARQLFTVPLDAALATILYGGAISLFLIAIVLSMLGMILYGVALDGRLRRTVALLGIILFVVGRLATIWVDQLSGASS